MQSRSGYLFSFKSLAIAMLGAFIALPAAAQNDTPPPWLDVVIVQVKNGEGPAFEDLLKDLQDARQAAGMPTGQVFQVIMGHPNEYHIVTPVQSIAATEAMPPPMPEAQMAVWQERITRTVDSVRFFYASTYPANGIQAAANAPQPTHLLLRTIRVASGHETDYESWITNTWLPAFRETRPLGHTMSRGIFGDSPQNFYHAYPLAGLAGLDAPDPLMSLGQRRYDQIVDALGDIVESHELIVAVIRTDLMAQ